MSKPGKKRLGRFNAVFNPEEEEELVSYIQKMERALFGLTPLDVRHLAFEYATGLKLNHRFKKVKQIAGQCWLNGFLKRHPILSIRKPEATSLARAVGFNKPQITGFFNAYTELLSTNS